MRSRDMARDDGDQDTDADSVGHGVISIVEEGEGETETEDDCDDDDDVNADNEQQGEQERLIARTSGAAQQNTRHYNTAQNDDTIDDYHPLLSSPSKAPDFEANQSDFGYGTMDLSMLLGHGVAIGNGNNDNPTNMNTKRTNNTNNTNNNTRNNNRRTTFQIPQLLQPQSQASQQHQRVSSEFSFFAGLRRNGGAKRRERSASTTTAPGHHRRQSSISRLMDSLGDGLTHGIGTILHDVQDSARDVKRSWKEELETANDGRFGFLDASLMRGLSILPEDVESWADQRRASDRLHQQQLHQQQQQLHQQLHPDEEIQTNDKDDRHEESTTEQHEPEIKAKPLGAGPYIALLGAVLAVSSNGTALTLQSKVPPPLKLYWRMVGTSLVLVPFAIRLLFWKEGFPKLNVGQWATLGLAVACYVAHNLCFITALTYTSIGNAVLFANTQALILLAGKALTGVEIEALEYMGAIVAFSGAIMCATDEDRVTFIQQGNGNDAAFGDLLAMVSADFGVGYLTFAKAVRPATSVVTFMFLVMSAGSCLVLLYMTITDEHITADRHLYHGLFGWMSLRYDRLPLEMWIVLVCNVVGTMGFVRSMQDFDAIIIAISTLLEPMVASVIATLLHVGVLPGPQGWLGNFLVVIGTFGVVYPSATKGDSAGH